MSATEPKRRRKHSALGVLGAVVAVVLVIFIWLIATPGPMGEAGDGVVAMASAPVGQGRETALQALLHRAHVHREFPVPARSTPVR